MSEFIQKFLANQSLNKQIYEVLIMANCKNCGTEVPESAGSCPRCGDEIGRGKPGVADRTGPRQDRYGKTPEYRLLTAITGGLSILLLGVLIYMAAIDASPLVTWSNIFAWFLLGHGALLALKYFANLLTPSPMRAKHGYLIGGALIAAIGALCLAGFGDYFWPIAILGMAVYILAMGILKYYSGNGTTTAWW